MLPGVLVELHAAIGAVAGVNGPLLLDSQEASASQVALLTWVPGLAPIRCTDGRPGVTTSWGIGNGRCWRTVGLGPVPFARSFAATY